jgi:hypothetical protein
MSGMPIKSIENNRLSVVRIKPLCRTAGNTRLIKPSNISLFSRLHEVDGVKVELPFASEFVYQHFLTASLESMPYLAQARKIIQGESAYVSLGGPNGADLTGPEGIHSPPGWDRAYVANLGPFLALCAKGTGFARRAKDAYQNETYGLNDVDIHLPFDINPKITCIDHMVVGGNNFTDLLQNAEGAYRMLMLSFGLKSERGGILLPLSISLLKSFPAPLRDAQGHPVKDANGNQLWENMAGWNYFTNMGVFKDEGKMLRIARFVERKTESRIIGWASRLYIKNIEKGKKASKLIRWLVGRAFMKIYRPGTYSYIGDSFRIGNAYRQLVSNGFRFIEKGLVEQGLIDGPSPLTHVDNTLLKKYMDRVLISIYAPHGGVNLPDKTDLDLRTERGRRDYLKEVKKLNAEKSARLAVEITKEIARQLGILHGAGGDGGGHEDMHALGKIKMVLENPKDGSVIYAVLKLDHVLEIYNDREEQKKLDASIDLKGYKIIAVETDKHGDFERGAPGGGAVRPDNLGYGLRDLHSVDILSHLFGIAMRYPNKINNLEIKDVVYHLHTKIIQEAEFNLLFAHNLGEPIDGKDTAVSGAIYQLNDVFGGGEEGANKLIDIFWREYKKWHGLSARKYASEAYQKIEADPPIYIIKGSYRKHETDERLNEYLNNAANASKNMKAGIKAA